MLRRRRRMRVLRMCACPATGTERMRSLAFGVQRAFASALTALVRALRNVSGFASACECVTHLASCKYLRSTHAVWSLRTDIGFQMMYSYNAVR